MGSSKVELTIIGAWNEENEATLRERRRWTAPFLLCVAGLHRYPGGLSSVFSGCYFRAPSLCSPDKAAEA